MIGGRHQPGFRLAKDNLHENTKGVLKWDRTIASPATIGRHDLLERD